MLHARARRPLLATATLSLLAGTACLLLGAATATATEQAGGDRVLVTTLAGAIGPVTADHVVSGVDRAEDEGLAAYVLRLDTPGGLDTSMRAITSRLLEAQVPVVVHVAPRGARAASAGALITYAAHVAAMAPGTAIGAATPVDLEGGDVGAKIVNDAAALAESIAEARGRDVDFAVDSVREARSASANEAVELGVVDVVVGSLEELLAEIDGTAVTLAGGDEVTLSTAGAAVEEYDLGLFRQILVTLADPNLAFLFLSVGTLGLVYELASPGIGVGGVVGASMIVLAMFGLSVLPINAAGFLFLLLALALFAAELFAPGIGVAAAGGAVALVLSGVFLFDDAAAPGVSIAVLAPTAVVVFLLVVGAGRLALRDRHAASTTTGAGALVGRTATVRRVTDGRPQAVVEGGWWELRPADGGPLQEGDEIRVLEVDGLVLVVEHVETTDPAGTAPPATTERGSPE